MIVPEGYTAEVLIAWGDPVSKGPAFVQDASNSAHDQARQWGMHNDGLVYFPINGSKHGLLVQNCEYSDDGLLFTDGTQNWDAEKTKKSQAAHGVAIIEIVKLRGKRHDWDEYGKWCRWGAGGGEWRVVRPSKYARRITGYTPIRIGGPAAGDERLKTSADPTGRRVLGTINNCAMGFTPWGTYLACEENFNGYFRKTGTRTPLEVRYGITATGAGYLWHETDTRFNADLEPNEAHRFGWVVEIDPWDRKSRPVKRTALGRLKHEGAWVQEARDGRVVVYMGDDEVFEYIYRYVSRLPWRKSLRQGINPLDDGVLYVGKFLADGSGEWLPLVPGAPGLETWTLNDILINTRGAADAVGATKMDRPEWIDTFPEELTAIGSLTNNTRRGTTGNPGPDGGPNPRGPNPYGQLSEVVLPQRLHGADLRLGDLRARRRSARTRRTARRSSATSTARRTGSTSRRAGGCGSRRTSRRAPSTRGRTPASATTRCCARIPRPARRGASWWGRRPARSRASS